MTHYASTGVDYATMARRWKLITPDGVREVRGTLLGEASSKSTHHTDHPTAYAERGEPCSACRWFEVKIIRPTNGGYVVWTSGRTKVPGEIDYCRLLETESEHTVIEALVLDRDERRFIPKTSRIALTEAAKLDTQLRYAYEPAQRTS